MDIARSSRRTRPIPLTPLIDVVFLLIVFFMLSTTFIRIQSLEINLPGDNVKAPAPSLLTEPAYIDISSKNIFLWNGTPLALESLKNQLLTSLKIDQELPIIIRVDQHVSVQKLVSVLDLVHLQGGKHVSIEERNGQSAPTIHKGSKQYKQIMEEEKKHIPILDEETIKRIMPKTSPREQNKSLLDILGQ